MQPPPSVSADPLCVPNRHLVDYVHRYVVALTVTNTGGVEATATPQLYLGFPPSAGEPPCLLRGFAKVCIARPVLPYYDTAILHCTIYHYPTLSR